LYALSVPSLEAKDKRAFNAQVELHKVGEAVLMGTYKRSRW
jgi:hypothetical protein